jgi:hypothetical protein
LSFSDQAQYSVVDSDFYTFNLRLKPLAWYLVRQALHGQTPDTVLPDDRLLALVGEMLARIVNHRERELPDFIKTLLGEGVLSTLSHLDGFVADYWNAHPRPDRLMKSGYAADVLSHGSKSEVENLLREIEKDTKHGRNLDHSGPVRGKFYKKRFKGDPKILHKMVSKIRASLSRKLTDRDARRPEDPDVFSRIETAYKEAYGEGADLTPLVGIHRQKDLTGLACEIVVRRDTNIDKRKVRRHYRAYEASLNQ